MGAPYLWPCAKTNLFLVNTNFFAMSTAVMFIAWIIYVNFKTSFAFFSFLVCWFKISDWKKWLQIEFYINFIARVVTFIFNCDSKKKYFYSVILAETIMQNIIKLISINECQNNLLYHYYGHLQWGSHKKTQALLFYEWYHKRKHKSS